MDKSSLYYNIISTKIYNVLFIIQQCKVNIVVYTNMSNRIILVNSDIMCLLKYWIYFGSLSKSLGTITEK